MKVLIATLSGETSTIDVSDDLTIESLQALAAAELKASRVVLAFNGSQLRDMTKTLTQTGIKDGDIILAQPLAAPSANGASARRTNARPPADADALAAIRNIDFSQIQIPSTSSRGHASAQSQPRSPGLDSTDAASVLQHIGKDPHALSLLRERNPPLAAAIEQGNIPELQKLLDNQRKQMAEAQQMYIRAMNADDFDAEAQKFIEDKIRQENLDVMLEHAMEHTPEAFGSVTMLYINARVNGYPVKAFVDSGAQTTIISSSFAQRCNIMHLVDKRFSGLARGVGTQKIIGKVHLAQLQIEKDYLQTSFIVLEDQTMDMLLGLDMLKRHQCVLDLQTNHLKIGTTGTATPFLSESELPEHARHLLDPAKELEGLMDTTTNGPAGDKTFSEDVIKRITEMGFDRPIAIKALQEASGNVEMAVASLLAKGLQGK